jgi:transcriptional regulator with XRE-family HTH domain
MSRDWLAASRYRVEYGRRLAAARVDAGLTQAELGVRIGLSRASVANIEGGRQAQTAEQVMITAQATCVDPRWLLTGWSHGTRVSLNAIAAHVTDLRKLAAELEQGVL